MITDKFVESMREVDFSGMQMPVIVVYDSPRDFPGICMCRVWEGAVNRPTNVVMKKRSVKEMRSDIRAAGFTVRFPRVEGDDPVIVESWLK